VFGRFGQHDPSEPIAAHRRQESRLFCRIGPHAASLGNFVTVLGLCFGGGQLALGSTELALGILVLEGLKRLESRWKQDRHATLSLKVDADGPTEDELNAILQASGYEIHLWAVTFVDQGRQRELSAEVCWRARLQETRSPAFLQSLVQRPGVLQLEWKP
jgi:putative Mg2+ transporter-C (MgtC) family protein